MGKEEKEGREIGRRIYMWILVMKGCIDRIPIGSSDSVLERISEPSRHRCRRSNALYTSSKACRDIPRIHAHLPIMIQARLSLIAAGNMLRTNVI